MKRILVTGGAGFIGSHLTERLLAEGHSVVVLDDLSGGRRDNLKAVLAHHSLEFVHGSAADQEVVGRLVADADLVYHLAASVGVAEAVSAAARVFANNLATTRTVVSAASRHRKPLYFTSSSEVYGCTTEYPFREDQPLILPPPNRSRWGYACAKAAGEWQVLAARTAGELPHAAVVRLFNTVGPRQSADQGMVLARFAEQLQRGEPLTVYGSGTQTRCFVHVLDVVDALSRLPDNVASDGQVFNLGHDEEVSIEVLARRLSAMAGGVEIRRVHYERAYPRGFEEVPRRRPDLSKARALLGFAPRRSLNSILIELCERAGINVLPTAAAGRRIAAGL